MRALATAQATTVAATLCAIAALLAAAFRAPAGVVAVLALVSVAVVVLDARRALWRRGSGRAGTGAVARAAVCGAVLAHVAQSERTVWTMLTAVAAALVLLLLGGELPLRQAWISGARFTANLPGAVFEGPGNRWGGRLQGVAFLALTACVVAVVVPPLGVVALVLAATYGVVGAVWARDAVRRKPTIRPLLRTALEEYAAPVMLYITGPRGTQYQIGAWAAELERLDTPLVIVARETSLARAVAQRTTLPVVAAPSIADLEATHVPSFRVALYVNNGAKNGHNVRYRDLTHVQLLHGDSDKPASYNPVTAMFDKVFVAGQAGVDRYRNHGVAIPDEKFVIVGRPQVASIEAPVSDQVATVLYAPTWTGFNQDSNFGSLAWGPQIVTELLARGWRVVFRPHPFSVNEARSRASIAEIHRILEEHTTETGTEHLWGDRATAELSVVDCFNLADALVSDVSSVPTDFLYSAKPFVITQVDETPDDDFVAEFPLARAAYRARLTTPGSLEAALDGFVEDSLRETRESTRTYYLGDIPRETYRDAFGDAVRALVAAAPAPDPDLVQAADVEEQE